MDLIESKRQHPSMFGRHHVTLTTFPGGFQGDCTCGASSGLVQTAGMVHGWEAFHRDSEREAAIVALEARDRAWELFESMHGGES
ncbi:MAG TPA: hypothetical protein VGE43_19610 [Acidimicrobiales bacterium]